MAPLDIDGPHPRTRQHMHWGQRAISPADRNVHATINAGRTTRPAEIRPGKMNLPPFCCCRSGFSREPHRDIPSPARRPACTSSPARDEWQKRIIIFNGLWNTRNIHFHFDLFHPRTHTHLAYARHRLSRCSEHLRCSTALLRCTASTARMIKISPSLQLQASRAERSDTNAEAVCTDAAAPGLQQ